MRTLRLLAVGAVVLSLTACGSGSGKYEYPFQNPNLKIEKRVENLLSLLTPEEKVGLMMNGSISIDSLHWNTSDHNQFGKTRATGGAWHQGLSFWCPNINIFRDPRWGRGQETSGEDPYLTGKMGTALVKGMQGDNPKYYKTHACAKHYAVHSGLEADRHRFDVSVSMRDLWETYLPAFKTLVTEANVQEVMCAYNRYEGEPCCGSDRLLTDILRNKWGFKALVVSDWTAAPSTTSTPVASMRPMPTLPKQVSTLSCLVRTLSAVQVTTHWYRL